MITPFTPAIRNANKPRVLIVDDNPRFGQSVRLILQQSGHYVVCQENDAASALGTARSFRPDLILLDLVMPQLSSPEPSERQPVFGAMLDRIQSVLRLRRHPFPAWQYLEG